MTWAALKTFAIASMGSAVSASLLVFGGSCLPSVHHSLWEGRPLMLIAIDFGNEMAVTALTAFVVSFSISAA